MAGRLVPTAGDRELRADYLDRYRLWFVDRAMHVNPSRYLSPNEGFEHRHGQGPTDTQVISYQGVLHQALHDVAAWAERGVEPPGETTYQLVDGQIEVPPTAAARGCVQPVATLTVNGGDRADVAVGEPVELVGNVDVPPAAGVVVWGSPFGKAANLARVRVVVT